MKKLIIATAFASMAFADGLSADIVAMPERLQIEVEPSPDDDSGRIWSRSKPASAKKTLRSVSDAQEELLGDPSHSYFLLISGGVNYANNKIRFWADTATYYSTLRLKYKVPKENITLLVSDGGAFGLDVVAKTNISGTNCLVLVSSPMDMDGDGEPDVNGPADFVAVTNALMKYERELTPDDQLTVFVASHGSSTGNPSPDNHDCVAWLFDATGGQGEFITDYELAQLTKGIGCPVGFAIESCYSGGFIDDITNFPDRVIATACRNDERSVGWDTVVPFECLNPFSGAVPLYNCWAYPFNCAVRGLLPPSLGEYGAYPWQDDESYNSRLYCQQADLNGDGLVSFREAFEFSVAFDIAAKPASDPHETPQFAESTPGLGERFFTLKQESELVPPGGPIVCGTADEASNILAKAKFTPSAVVAEKLGTRSEALRTYSDMFKLGVAPFGESRWAVEAQLLPDAWSNVVESAQKVTRQIPLADIAALPMGEQMNVTVHGGVPGFYYSFCSGGSVIGLKTLAAEGGRNVLCGPDREVKFSGVTKPSDAAGFFSVGVTDAPGVNPSDRPAVK